jgi:hypothetical protein
VACQPAIQVGLLLTVTIDTETHLEMNALDPVHGLHRSMTLFAGNILLYVPFVIEDDVFGQIVDLTPRGRGVRVVILVFLPDLGMIGDNVLVTIETFLDRWDSRVNGTPHVGMTELALDLLDTRMESMTI